MRIGYTAVSYTHLDVYKRQAFILDYLKEGEKETADLDGMMKAQGVSGETLKRAKAERCV